MPGHTKSCWNCRCNHDLKGCQIQNNQKAIESNKKMWGDEKMLVLGKSSTYRNILGKKVTNYIKEGG